LRASAALFAPLLGFGLACASSTPKAYEAPIGTSLYEPDPEEAELPPRAAPVVEPTPRGSFALPAPLRSGGPNDQAAADGGAFVDDEGMVEDDEAGEATGEAAGAGIVESVEP
jgi:hypothetical protein